MLKTVGMIILFSACLLWGFSKSFCLLKRRDALDFYSKAVFLLAERIKSDSSDYEKTIPLCFGEKATVSAEGFSFSEEFLEKEDIALLREFFSSLGTLCRQAEYERTELYCRLLREKAEDAKEKCSLCRLYRSIGALSGVTVIIFLI